MEGGEGEKESTPFYSWLWTAPDERQTDSEIISTTSLNLAETPRCHKRTVFPLSTSRSNGIVLPIRAYNTHLATFKHAQPKNTP